MKITIIIIIIINNTSHIFKGMVGLVEMNIHRDTPAVVLDTLFMIIQSKS